MKKEFDFDDIGKKTPYRTPEHFFEDMQKQVMERANIKQPRKKSHLKLIISGAIAAAAVLTGFLFFPRLQQQTDMNTTSTSAVLAIQNTQESASADDSWIRDLSDEELEELVRYSDSDIFLN